MLTAKIENKDFIRIWNDSNGIDEVITKTGLSRIYCFSRAAYLRAKGINMKHQKRPNTKWKDEWNILLATEAPEKLAVRFGVSTALVRAKCMKLGLGRRELLRKKRETELKKITNEEFASKSLKEICRQHKLPYPYVGFEKTSRDLRPFIFRESEKVKNMLLRAAIAGMIGGNPKTTDAEIGRILHLTRERIRQIKISMG